MIAKEHVEHVKSLVNETLLFKFWRIVRAHQVVHYFLYEQRETRGHVGLPAHLSQHLETCSRLEVQVVSYICAFVRWLSVLVHVNVIAEHHNATVSQDVVLEHLCKVEKTGLKLDFGRAHLLILLELVCDAAESEHLSDNVEVIVLDWLFLVASFVCRSGTAIHRLTFHGKAPH